MDVIEKNVSELEYKSIKNYQSKKNETKNKKV